MLILMKQFCTKEYLFPAVVKCEDQYGTSAHVNCLIYTVEKNSLFSFNSTRKGKLCVTIFSGDVVFTCMI